MTSFKIIDNIKCYAPELAVQNNDYSSESFEVLFNAENSNFWFISRNKVIEYLFRKYLGKKTNYKVLEVGCGTGYVLTGLSKNKNYNLTGAEIYLEGLKYARQRLPDVEFIQMDATCMPFKSEFDAVGAFDVLEHIQEDELVIANIFSAIKEGGFFFVSVPQYKFMWSYLDDIAFHKRRYNRNELKEKIERAGFKVKYIGSFVFALFPAMFISRLIKKQKKIKEFDTHHEMYHELYLSPFLNSLFKLIMKVDELLIKTGISLPFGGSLVLVAEK
jgi:ubiquinone/menaquinone biosynthesis C-methylase UbiE